MSQLVPALVLVLALVAALAAGALLLGARHRRAWGDFARTRAWHVRRDDSGTLMIDGARDGFDLQVLLRKDEYRGSQVMWTEVWCGRPLRRAARCPGVLLRPKELEELIDEALDRARHTADTGDGPGDG